MPEKADNAFKMKFKGKAMNVEGLLSKYLTLRTKLTLSVMIMDGNPAFPTSLCFLGDGESLFTTIVHFRPGCGTRGFLKHFDLTCPEKFIPNLSYV